MPTTRARYSLVASHQAAKRFYDSHKKECQIAYRFTIGLVFIPGVLAAIGAIVERGIYGTLNRPNFSPLLMFFGGLIASPFILIRWFWPVKMKEHLEKLEFVYYVLFSAGFIVAIITTTVAGNELFYTGKHVRSVFGGKDSNQFLTIATRDDVYLWLNETFQRVYDQRGLVNDFSRELPGRLLLNGPIRLNQYRAAAKACSKRLKSLGLVDSNHCYTSDDQDRSPYSQLNFTYHNPSYKNYVGDNIFASDISLKGTLNMYPLAGHWVLFGPNFNMSTVAQMLNALQINNWIDDKTRMISLDCTIVAPDFPRTTVVSTIHLIEVTKSGFLVPESPQVNFNFLDDASGDSDPEADSNNSETITEGNSSSSKPMTQSDKCNDVTKHPNFFGPIYLGILPALVYTIFMHVLALYNNWRKYLHNPFTYSELAWFITVMLSIIFRWRSIYFDHCTISVISQSIYPRNDSVEVGVFEFIPIANEWFESRRVLGLALFLHLFNFLKFIVQIPALSSLIQTLKIAFSELASFSLSFLVVFFAFVFMFYIIFSVESADYQNIPRCISTLWLGMLGELSITPELWRVKDWTIPMVVLFTFISVFVLLTVIIAIISDAHERSRVQREKQEERRKQIAKEVMSKWSRRREQGKGQAPGGDGSANTISLPSGTGTGRDSNFAGVVDLALLARKSKSSSQLSSGMLDSVEANGKPSPVHSENATPGIAEHHAEMSHTSSTVVLVPGTPKEDNPSNEDRPALSKITAKSAARFLNTGQARKRQRASPEPSTLAMTGHHSNASAKEENASGDAEQESTLGKSSHTQSSPEIHPSKLEKGTVPSPAQDSASVDSVRPADSNQGDEHANGRTEMTMV